jgi:hypothetical protein
VHLAAIEPNAEVLPLVRAVGFDSVTHYVLLPDWKGPFLQDYREYAERRAGEWRHFAERSGLPYMPSVAPGWDASPRGADFGPPGPTSTRGRRWSPASTPNTSRGAAARARVPFADVGRRSLVLVASLNEWSEGHYLEPDERFGTGWLEAVRSVNPGA